MSAIDWTPGLRLQEAQAAADAFEVVLTKK